MHRKGPCCCGRREAGNVTEGAAVVAVLAAVVACLQACVKFKQVVRLFALLDGMCWCGCGRPHHNSAAALCLRQSQLPAERAL
jgi:hypothetical protein